LNYAVTAAAAVVPAALHQADLSACIALELLPSSQLLLLLLLFGYCCCQAC
jgi:hypothetical protein